MLTYWERPGDDIATNMAFVDEVEWGTVIAQKTLLINVVSPIVNLRI